MDVDVDVKSDVSVFHLLSLHALLIQPLPNPLSPPQQLPIPIP